MRWRGSDMNALIEYWNTNVSNWQVAGHLEAGTKPFFAEIERYRFAKLDYLEQAVGFNNFAGKKVLDVGCGLGTDLSHFASSGALTTGIDIAERAIDLAQANFNHGGHEGEFAVMDGEALDFPDDTFDFVYCHTVLHFTREPAAMVREIKRVLKPGGRALLMTINRQSWLYFLHRVGGMKIDYMDAPVFHKMSPAEFTDLVGVFDKVEVKLFRFPVRTEVHKGWKAFLYNTLFVDLYNAMPKRLIGNTGYHLLAFVEKKAEATNL